MGEIFRAEAAQKGRSKEHHPLHDVAVVGLGIFHQGGVGAHAEQKIKKDGENEKILHKREGRPEYGVEHTHMKHLHRAAQHFRERLEEIEHYHVDAHGREHAIDKGGPNAALYAGQDHTIEIFTLRQEDMGTHYAEGKPKDGAHLTRKPSLEPFPYGYDGHREYQYVIEEVAHFFFCSNSSANLLGNFQCWRG